jgi:hypothetical protein
LRENDTKPVVVVRFCVLLTDVGGAHLGDLAHLQLGRKMQQGNATGKCNRKMQQEMQQENATVLLP